MAVRTDLTIDWSVSPRLITVAAPSVEITIQDLVDTCRESEEQMFNLSYARLIDAAGKEPLGGGVLVGITATLNNAQVAFEARPGPSWELMIISGGNLVALDDVGGEIDPRYPTAFTTIDRSASSSATIVEVGTASGPDAPTIADAVWDEVLSGHLTSGTTGEKLNDSTIPSDIPTAQEIADLIYTDPRSPEVQEIAEAVLNAVAALEGATPRDPDSLGYLVNHILQMLTNKTITDPNTGLMTVYDDDGVAVLRQAPTYEGINTSQPYRGQGAERRDRLE